MYYYVFRKNVNDASIKNCEKFTDLEEAKAGAQDEEYYRSHANSRAERDSWRVVLAASEEKWEDLTSDAHEYEELDYNA